MHFFLESARGLAACAVDILADDGIPAVCGPPPVPADALQYRPAPHNPKKGEVIKKPMKTKALCAAATAVLFALVSAPSAYCAETDAPGADGYSAAPLYLECSPAFQWLCDIFGL